MHRAERVAIQAVAEQLLEAVATLAAEFAALCVAATNEPCEHFSAIEKVTKAEASAEASAQTTSTEMRTQMNKQQQHTLKAAVINRSLVHAAAASILMIVCLIGWACGDMIASVEDSIFKRNE